MYEEQFPTYESPPIDTSPRPFGEIPGLWLKVTQMTEEFFAQEAPRASGSNTLISVLILAVVSVIFSTISVVISGGFQMAGMSSEYRGTFATALGSTVVCSLCGGLVASIVGFYLGNGLTYLGARILGGSGDFGTQVYLQSLFAVPVGIITAPLSLASLVPYAGPCVSGVAMLALAAYVIVLNVRAVKVAHNLTTGQAVAAVFAPVLLVVILACLVIVVLALLGPAIGNIFENIVTNI